MDSRERRSGSESKDDDGRGGWWKSFFQIFVLAAIGVGGAFLWKAYAISTLMVVAATDVPDGGLLQNILTAQQGVIQLAQTNQALLQSQATEIKQLSATVVQLVARLNTLEARARDAQAAEPPSIQKPTPPRPRSRPARPRSAVQAPMQVAPQEKQ
jgi:hypothetical protein